jgi:hypothetical protein
MVALSAHLFCKAAVSVILVVFMVLFDTSISCVRHLGGLQVNVQARL